MRNRCELVRIVERDDLVRIVERDIEAVGAQAFAIHADATDPDTIKRMTSSVVKELDRIDILVNNVGRSVVRPILETDETHWEPMLRINAQAAFLWSKYTGEIMVGRKSGCIINIASDLGKTADQYSGLYIMAKHAVIGLTKAMQHRN
jgi:short-subunit dehydrogenase